MTVKYALYKILISDDFVLYIVIYFQDIFVPQLFVFKYKCQVIIRTNIGEKLGIKFLLWYGVSSYDE